MWHNMWRYSVHIHNIQLWARCKVLRGTKSQLKWFWSTQSENLGVDVLDIILSLLIHQNAHYEKDYQRFFVMLLTLQDLKRRVCCVWCTHSENKLSDLSSLKLIWFVKYSRSLFLLERNRIFHRANIWIDGPTIHPSCHYIALSCKDKVRHKKNSKFALARGLWLGEYTRWTSTAKFHREIINW